MKKIEDTFIRYNRIHERDGRTDGRTQGETDTWTPHDGIDRAKHGIARHKLTGSQLSPLHGSKQKI